MNANTRLVPLSFGAGLDRASGLAVRLADRPYDARNVHLTPGRSEMRRGLVRALGLPADAILQIQPVESTQQVAVTVLNGLVSDLYLCDIAPNGDLLPVNLWQGLMTFDQSISRAPIVVGESAYDRVIFAHAEPIIERRNNTLIFDAKTLAQPEPIGIVAEGDDPLDPYELFPVPFRGVRSHLEFLLGWGYGVPDLDEAAGEILRVSLPGMPHRFRELHYLTVGRRGTPIVDVQSFGGGAAIFKETETYWLTGAGRANWGHRQIDPRFGLLADRLAITVGDVCYFWSLEGPRKLTGAGRSVDLGFPLNLRARFRDAPEFSDRRQGFAVYTPFRNEVEWIFGRFGYVLNIASEEWTTNEYASEPLGCGAVLPVLERADEFSRAPRFPRPAIVGAACAQGDDIRPVIVGASCSTVVSAQATLVRPVLDVNRATLRVTMQEPVLLGDVGFTPGNNALQNNWNGGKIDSIEFDATGSPVRTPVPAGAEQVHITAVADDSGNASLGSARHRAEPADTVVGPLNGGSFDGNTIPFAAVNRTAPVSLTVMVMIRDYGIVISTFDSLPSLQKLRNEADVVVYEESEEIHPILVGTMTFRKGLVFRVIPSTSGCEVVIRYRATAVGGAYSESAPIAVDPEDEGGTRCAVNILTENLSNNPGFYTNRLPPPDDNPTVKDATYEAEFPEYDYQVVLKRTGVPDQTILAGTARLMYSDFSDNVPAFAP